MPDYAYDRLSVVDNSFLAIEDPNAHQHVGAVTLFEAGPLRNVDGGIDIDRIREYVAARLHLIPRYRQRLARVPLGTRLVWVVDPERRSVTTYRALLAPRVLGADDAIDAMDLLPGLTIQVASIFESSLDSEV